MPLCEAMALGEGVPVTAALPLPVAVAVPLPERVPVGEGVVATVGVGEGGRHALPQDRSSTKPGGHTGVSARTECKSIT